MTTPADPAGAGQPAPAPRSVPEVNGSWFEGVVQVGDIRRMTATGEGLSLSFDERGMEVGGPRPGERRPVPWAEVTRVSLGVAQAGAHGGFATPIEIESVGGIARFLIPSEHLESAEISALDRQLAAWSTSDGAQLPAPAPHGLLPAFPEGPDRPPAVRPRRSRRRATLVVGVVLVLSGIGLAFALSGTGTGVRATPARAPRPSSDQRLADQLMLSRSDLPHGWTINTDSGSGNSPQMRSAESAITKAFARCMGITDQKGSVVLGGPASDQTAQTSSPVFVAPSSPEEPGFAFELQTAARIVRTHRNEQDDAALYANSRYPQCVATAVAAEVQLGANNASGQNDQPGPASATMVDLHAPAGEQLSGLIIAFTVSDRSMPVPVEVEAVSLGTGRIEADLQAFSIGGRIPTDVLAPSVSTFEQRVAGNGRSAVV
ncbi:MAG TPA: hypothetical protein VID75_01485 [Acidimicrobiales bacterium]|jgi:hypothetical protein